MQIFVKDLENNTQVFQAGSLDELKQQIFLQTGIAETCQNLICNGCYLYDNEALEENSTLHLTIDLLGGKGKKKKVYTTKKKNHHHHKSEKLHTLKFYSVEKNGKIVRTRKVCPQCGPGVFMAKHLDRHYCGRCAVSLKLDTEAIKAAQEALKKKGTKKAAENVEETEKKGAKKEGKKKK